MRHAQHEARHASVPTRLCCSRLTFRSVLTKEGRGFRPHIPCACLSTYLVDGCVLQTFFVFSSGFPGHRFRCSSSASSVAVTCSVGRTRAGRCGVLEFYPWKSIGILSLQSEKTAAVLDSTGGCIGASIGYGLVPTPALLIIS